MCILVANPNHSVQLESGNCFILPDVNVTAPLEDMTCLAGPGLNYPAVAQMRAGQLVMVEGISPDEGWWNVTHPETPDSTCWLARNRTSSQVDLAVLPLVEPPPVPTGEGTSNLFVEITNILLQDNRYVTEYVTQNFEEQLPGTHIHFFFNAVEA